ncbi:MAG: hypothetical protein GYA57_04925, partial [Myxococcales bacterium]|nr:hypothetical protein [Myxococcales bacterium]
MSRLLAAGPALLVVAACGGKTEPWTDAVAGPEVPAPEPELCDGLDNDLDGVVDNGFRNPADGTYGLYEHCGRCGATCEGAIANAAATACEEVRERVWACRATLCADGYTPTADRSHCVPLGPLLCRPCADDGDCNVFGGACREIGGELRCTASCGDASPDRRGCPEGYDCAGGLCLPAGGSCWCGPGEFFAVSCDLPTPGGGSCLGHAECRDGVLSECLGSEEICDEIDNDCNGVVDDPYVDVRGVYSVDVHNCGACGVDCTTTSLPGMELTCGGDPYAPRCRILCADEVDGVQVGDRLDADLDIANGCECTVTAIDDQAGPFDTYGNELDVNCDGADGVVVRSLYVAPDGDDAHPGSPFYPMRTIGAAVARAAESLATERPLADVFVAAGTYVEVLRVPDGVRVHGGYRNDFLGLAPEAFLTVVISDDASSAPGGAALVLDRAGVTRTVVEGLQFRGADAPAAGRPAFGAWIRSPGPALELRRTTIRAGQGGAGQHGTNGAAGVGPTAEPAPGAPQRLAVESSRHECLRTAENVVRGGDGGRSVCGTVDVSGGRGGDADCSSYDQREGTGEAGRSGGAGAPGGAGGLGGYGAQGPTFGVCEEYVCCGVFSVLPEYELAADGGNGANGAPGTAGVGCADPLG